jgi:signal transduction histidine kinase
MQSYFAPAIALMNRLKYVQKFLLVGFLLVLPLGLVMSQYLAEVEYDINFSAKERIGLEYNTPLVDLLREIEQHAAISSALLSGNDAYQDDLLTIRDTVEARMSEVDAVDARLGAALAVGDSWTQIKEDWNELTTSMGNLSPERNMDAHSALTSDVLSLITLVGNNSNLILDPDLDSYYLMDILINKSPQGFEQLNQLRSYGMALLASESLSFSDATRLVILSGLVNSIFDAHEASFGYSFNTNASLAGPLAAAVDINQDAVNAYLDLLNRAIIEPASSGEDVSLASLSEEVHLAISTRALDTTFALYDNVTVALDSLLQTRIGGFVAERRVVIIVAFIALIGSVYLFAGFYLAVKKTIAALDQASKRMVSGQRTEALVLDNRDELAQVVIAFNTIANELVAARDHALEANRLKDEFLATMSHELRTPLNSIIGFTGIILSGMRGEVDETARNMIKRIKDSGHHLLGLINDILDIAKIEAGRLEIANSPIVLREMVNKWHAQMDVLARQKDLIFEVSIDPILPAELYGDEERITQVAINLLSNAMKFTEKGSVKLSIYQKDTHQWGLQVADSGIGIPPHALEYIFDEFRQVDGTTQRAYGGTGLGLAIVRKLCVAMGGRIQVASTQGEGSTFTATLPLHTGPARLETRRVEHVA